MTTRAGLTFLSWVRTGLVSGVRNAAGGAASPLDAGLPPGGALPVTLTLDGAGSGTFEARLVGPGDVVGLDANQVLRCDPAPGATGVAPNYFPCVELDRPDLPWMLTPGVPAEAKAGDADPRRGLRPWLCLVVVPDCPLEPPTTARPLPRLTVLDAELPDLETAWLWAHAQVLTQAGEDLAKVLAELPDRTLSRLVAPRRLAPDTTYLACLVPAFEAGRRAGLGQTPADGPLAPAWTRGTPPRTVELPVYHAWRFRTAQEPGDFEALADRIEAVLSGEAGVGRLDVGGGGAGLPGPGAGEAPWELPLEGILVGPAVVPGGWPAAVQQKLQDALIVRLAASAGELAPPTYGALQAAFRESLAAARAPRWLRELNLDPRYRVLASVGAQLVQRHQEALVASAWEQTAGIREANRILRQAQLARAVSQVLDGRVRGANGLPPDRLLELTVPVHGQVRAASGATVAAALRRSAPVSSAVSLAFRRIARPRGPLARRLAAAPFVSPVAPLALPAASPGALRPTPQLEAVGGTFALARVAAPGSGESLEAVTCARVETPVFPWETPPSGPPPNIPYAFHSDLVVTTQSVPGGGAPAGPAVTYVGGALDFDAIPQLGWTRRSSGGVPGGQYVDRGGVQGLLGIGGGSWSGDPSYLYWQPGYLFEPTGAIVKGDAPPSPAITGSDGNPEYAELKGVAVADLRGSGGIDLVCLFDLTKKYYTGRSGSGVWVDRSEHWSCLRVGLGFDPATARVLKWTDACVISARQPTPPPAPSLTAAGKRLFVAREGALRMMELEVDEPTWAQAHLQVRAHAVSAEISAVSHDIIAADFGGTTGVDLLLTSIAGQDGNLSLRYRVAYDIDASGRIGRWGRSEAAPIPVAGGNLSVKLGVTTAAGAQRRAAATAAFRAASDRTQARQQRITAAAAPPPPAPGVQVPALAADVGAAMDPGKAIEEAIAAQLALEAPIDPAAVTDPLQPLALTPRFPYPMYELLRDAFQERLFPGASKIADDSATVLVVDRPALEAFLVGLNHEMSRELLWRQFPVRHGTFFSRFWDARRDDISSVERWSGASALGAHAPAGVAQPSLLLVVRAELLRRIPDAAVYAVPAVLRDGRRAPDLARPRQPIFGGKLLPDVRFFAFDAGITTEVARGDDGGQGWFFVFQEQPTGAHFGLDEAAAGAGTRPATWSELEWPQVAASDDAYGALVYVDAGTGSPLAGVELPDGGSSALTHRWGFSAAHMAHITLQRPMLVAIHGSRLVPGGKP